MLYKYQTAFYYKSLIFHHILLKKISNSLLFFFISLLYISALPCSISIENCQQCDLENKCINCNSGYALNFGSCIPCSSKIPNCRVCKTDGGIDRCYDCFNNYRPTTTSYHSDTCSKCNSPYCGACNEFNCLNCEPGYYLNAYLKCVPCPSKCVTCLWDGKCYSCKEGYYLEQNYCLKCEPNDSKLNCLINPEINKICKSTNENCLECNEQDVCVMCDDGYYLSNNACKPCNDLFPLCGKCRFEKEVLKCTECQPGNYFPLTDLKDKFSSDLSFAWYWSYSFFYEEDSTRCVPCTAIMCKECRSEYPSQCISCISGFFLVENSNRCFPCKSECEICSSHDNCLKCKGGYYLEKGFCQECLQNDQRYSCIFNSNQLNSCTNFDNCFACDKEKTKCLNCMQGYFLNAGSCISCNQITPNCRICMAIPEGSIVRCYDCQDGYMISQNGNCNRILKKNCIRCLYDYWNYWNQDNDCSCYQCSDGFWLNRVNSQENYCIPCNEGCLKCSSELICKNCKDGYYLDKNLCKKCEQDSQNEQCLGKSIALLCDPSVSHCYNCETSLTCKTCAVSYYLDNSNSCRSCSFSNCKNCFENFCYQCKEGFGLYYNYPNRYCTTCSTSKCSECNYYSQCTRCIKGYYLYSSKYCARCNTETIELSECVGVELSEIFCATPNCIECDANNQCITCNDGFYLNNGFCEECSQIVPNCFLCKKEGGIFNCLACKKGNYLTEVINFQRCLPCNSNSCDFCNSYNPYTCDVCSPGYYKITGLYYYMLYPYSDYCMPCPFGCKTCLSNQECTRCDKGYYLNGVCKLCPESNCEICNSSYPSKCLKCKSSYFLENEQCKKCPNYLSSSCESCSTEGKCLNCLDGYYLSSDNCIACPLNCKQCSDSTICQICQQGYFLFENQCNGCISNCKKCTNGSLCSICDDGYIFEPSSNSCVRCGENTNCSDCSQNGACLSCKAGYGLTDIGTCAILLAGMTNCTYLDGNSPNNCKTCDPDFYLNSENRCSRMSPECLKSFNSFLNVVKISYWCESDLKNLYAKINLYSDPIFLSQSCFSLSAFLQNDETKLYNRLSNTSLTKDNKIFNMNIKLSEIETAPCKKITKTDLDSFICNFRVFLNYENVPQASYEFGMTANIHKKLNSSNIMFSASPQTGVIGCKKDCALEFNPNSTLALCQDVDCKIMRTSLIFKRDEKIIFKQVLTDQSLMKFYYLDLFSIKFSTRIISDFDMLSICNVTKKVGETIFECSIPFADNGEGSKIIVTSLLVNSVNKRLLTENNTNDTNREYINKAIANNFEFLVQDQDKIKENYFSYGIKISFWTFNLTVILLLLLVSV